MKKLIIWLEVSPGVENFSEKGWQINLRNDKKTLSVYFRDGTLDAEEGY